jgi:hypothetical protein
MTTPSDAAGNAGSHGKTTASEVEFLRWVYRQLPANEQKTLRVQFVAETQKSVPSIGHI